MTCIVPAWYGTVLCHMKITVQLTVTAPYVLVFASIFSNEYFGKKYYGSTGTVQYKIYVLPQP